MGWKVQESNPGGGEIFRTRPYRPRDPSSLLHNGYRAIPRGEGGGDGRDVALTTHPYLEPKLQKLESCTSTPPLGLHVLFHGKLYFFT